MSIPQKANLKPTIISLLKSELAKKIFSPHTYFSCVNCHKNAAPSYFYLNEFQSST